MPSQILRPRGKYWLIKGPWGERRFPDMPRNEFYEQRSLEKFSDAVHHRTEVFPAIMKSSWDFTTSKWVDDPVTPPLKS
ncbi:MAG TPA: hypothetical protein DDY78_03795 [Planctomycetales bacterium]|jgi:hypothetical protein|nr:hypothetical protein [Planctomycetales bacterium]